MTVENAEVFAMEIEDKRWAMRIILPEITVAESMEFGASLAFEHWRSTLRGPHTEGVSREGRQRRY